VSFIGGAGSFLSSVEQMMSYVLKFRDRLLRLNTFVWYRGNNALVKELVDSASFWNRANACAVFHCGCGFDLSASAGLNMYTAHDKASARCAFLLSLLSEREHNKTRARGLNTRLPSLIMCERGPHPTSSMQISPLFDPFS
jgi:hypothetical protein